MISEGTYSMVQKIGGEHCRLVQIRKGQHVLIEKLRFKVDDAIGCKFGAFEVNGDRLKPIKQSELASFSSAPSTEQKEKEESVQNGNTSPIIKSGNFEENNEALNEAQRNQVISTDQIKLLKDSGIGTSELVSKLVDGNRSFEEKTEFSQKKYVRKKAGKHSDRILILKPTVRLLADSYYKRDPERIAHIRSDLLGLILQYSGVHYGSKTFVYDQVLGLLGASIIERLSGSGKCVFLHKGHVPQSIPCIHAMEFSEEKMKTFFPLSVESLFEENKKINEGNPSQISDTNKMEVEEIRATTEDALSETKDKQSSTSSFANPTKEDAIGKEKISLMSSPTFTDQFDSLLIAVNSMDPVDVLKRTFKFLRSSGSVVIYSPIIQHIIESHEWLYENNVINIRLIDQFQRAYQVLPGSTHPLMLQNVTGGYILAGIKVEARKMDKT